MILHHVELALRATIALVLLLRQLYVLLVVTALWVVLLQQLVLQVIIVPLEHLLLWCAHLVTTARFQQALLSFVLLATFVQQEQRLQLLLLVQQASIIQLKD